MYAFIGSVVLAVLFSFLMRLPQSRTPSGDTYFRDMGMFPGFGDRRDFTTIGWLFRNLMILFQVVAIASVIGWWLSSP
jgi:hypothetical protein